MSWSRSQKSTVKSFDSYLILLNLISDSDEKISWLIQIIKFEKSINSSIYCSLHDVMHDVIRFGDIILFA